MTAFNFIMRSRPPTRTNVADKGTPGVLGVVVYQVLQAPLRQLAGSQVGAQVCGALQGHQARASRLLPTVNSVRLEG
jgi:hypothetical protein